MPLRNVYLAVGFAIVLGSACGPSVGTIYEGNIRFEHCYRLDLDPHIAPTHRAECWREWADRYTYGQTRDRLEYAKRRAGALAAGDQTRPELRLDLPDGGGTAPATGPPAPTSLHASPPPLSKTPLPASASSAEPDASTAAHDAGREPPASGCISDCRESWQDCLGSCDPDAGPKRHGCKACDTDYGRCVQRCLK